MPTNHLEAGVRLKPGGALLDLCGEINGFARAPRTVTVEKTVEKTIPAATPEPRPPDTTTARPPDKPSGKPPEKDKPPDTSTATASP